MMRFVGITAFVDAGLVFVAWVMVYLRHASLDYPANKMVQYFSRYLVFTFLFLVLIGTAMLGFISDDPSAVWMRDAMVMLADIVLWVSLAYMVLLALVGKSPRISYAFAGAVLGAGFARTIFQLLALRGVQFNSENTLVFVLSQLDVILMYAVWVPVALLFFVTAIRAFESVTKLRSVMFGAGLLLITYSWVARLQLGSRSLTLISIVSIVGFGLLLGGVLYRKKVALAQV